VSANRRIAHDLKTPLSVIVGYAELLRARDDATTRREAPTRILEAAQRLSAEIDRLLELLPGDEPAAFTEPPSRRILLVDDDTALRGLLRATLPHEEYEVLEAANAQSALEQIDGEELDLVLLDWLLPDRRGSDILAWIRSARPHLPVIVLTAEVDAEAQAADAFLTKPFRPLELLDLVERLLSGRAPA
jgi:CheY-like chemotaxis protein